MAVTTPRYYAVAHARKPDGTRVKWDFIWDVRTRGPYKGKGKPTPKNIEKWVIAYANSQKIGGCNDHISKDRGYIEVPTKVEIFDQRDAPRVRKVVEWTRPAFWVH